MTYFAILSEDELETIQDAITELHSATDLLKDPLLTYAGVNPAAVEAQASARSELEALLQVWTGFKVELHQRVATR